jgi:hypothetical protein
VAVASVGAREMAAVAGGGRHGSNGGGGGPGRWRWGPGRSTGLRAAGGFFCFVKLSSPRARWASR